MVALARAHAGIRAHDQENRGDAPTEDAAATRANDGSTAAIRAGSGMNFALACRRALRSPMLWIALAMVVASAAATLAVGIKLYHHTATPMVYDPR